MAISCAYSTIGAHVWPVSVMTEHISPGVVVLPTGAWYDPETPGGLERHGNPQCANAGQGHFTSGSGFNSPHSAG